jgi:hypothetical protein
MRRAGQVEAPEPGDDRSSAPAERRPADVSGGQRHPMSERLDSARWRAPDRMPGAMPAQLQRF